MSNPPHEPLSPSDEFSDDPPSGDIPPARRQPTEVPLHEIEQASVSHLGSKRRSRSGLVFGTLLLISAASVGLWQWNRLDPDAPVLAGLKQTWASATARLGFRERPDSLSAPSAAASATDDADRDATSVDALSVSEDLSAPPSAAPSSAVDQTKAELAEQTAALPGRAPEPESATDTDTLLNHRRYDEASVGELVPLNPNSILKLQPTAQQAVSAMLAQARAEGVQLGVISAFRTVEDQNHLYFQIKAERGQSAEDRARVSAPPGYSEHHTGYAIDFIDESRPDTQLSQSFETTPAYQWLEQNAAFFNFEMSFPKDESSGVSYEPWHWRYVGDQKSLELFYKEQ